MLDQSPQATSNASFLLQQGTLLSLPRAETVYLGISKSRFLDKTKLKQLKLMLKKDRSIAIKELRQLMIPMVRSKIIVELLMKSGLHRMEVKILLKIMKQLFVELFKKPFSATNISLILVFWDRIPLQIRRLIIGIITMKQEIIHKFLLDLARDRRRIIKLNKVKQFNHSDEPLLESNREDFLKECGLNRNVIASTEIEEKEEKLKKLMQMPRRH